MTPPEKYDLVEIQCAKVVFNKHLVLHKFDPLVTDSDGTPKQLYEFVVGTLGALKGVWAKPVGGEWHFIPECNIHDIRIAPLAAPESPKEAPKPVTPPTTKSPSHGHPGSHKPRTR